MLQLAAQLVQCGVASLTAAVQRASVLLLLHRLRLAARHHSDLTVQAPDKQRGPQATPQLLTWLQQVQLQ